MRLACAEIVTGSSSVMSPCWMRSSTISSVIILTIEAGGRRACSFSANRISPVRASIRMADA